MAEKTGRNDTAFDQSIPPFNKNFNVYYVLGNSLDAGVTAMNKTDKNLCPHEAYILVEKEDQETKELKYVVCQMVIKPTQKNCKNSLRQI